MTAGRLYQSPYKSGRTRSDALAGTFESRGARPVPPASRQYWILVGLFVVALVLGGSSRADVATVPWLRPISIAFLAYALWSLPAVCMRRYRWLLGLVAMIVILHVGHLIPLPKMWWLGLPGREIAQRVDEFLGVNVWRPVSLDPESSWNALYALALPIAALTLAIQLTKVDHVRLVVLVVSLIAISGLLGVLQAAGSDWHPYPRSAGATGLFANRNHQAALLAVFFPLVAVATATSSRIWPKLPRGRILGWVLGAVAIPLVLVTGSRAGLLLSVIAILSIVGARLYRGPLFPRTEGRFSRLLSPWALVGGALLGGGTLAWLTIVQARGVALDRLEGGNFELRWPVWQGAWDLTRKFWPIGSGVGSYERVYQTYEPAALLRPTYSNHVHNDWLEILMTAGAPGLILLMLTVVLFGVALIRSIKGSGTIPLLRRLGIVTTALLALASVVDYPIRVPFVACVFALGWAWSFVGWDDDAKFE